jgi:hypothetical protein
LVGLKTLEGGAGGYYARVTMSSSRRHHHRVREEEEETKKKHATKKTKLEYTMQNCRENPSKYSPYVREFLLSKACAEMRENALFDSWMRKSSLVKEIEEATACVKQIERVLMKKTKKRGVLIEEEEALSRDGGEGLTFVDLCSGKGFLSIAISFAFPNARVEMMDRDESANVEHVEAMKNVTFRRVDVTSEECEKIVEDAANTSKFVFICGVHLCGDLSRVAIRLWRNVRRRMDGRAAIVLSPCCLPQRRRHDAFGFHVKDQARALKVDNYRLWCIFLSLEMRRCLMEDGGGGRGGGGVHMVQDEFMSGVKNTFLTCCCAECPPLPAVCPCESESKTNGNKAGISASILQASRWKISRT